jgi:hypothetical protein
MSEESITICLCLLVGVVLVSLPRQMATWFCGHIKELCMVPGNEWFVKWCSGAFWIVERISLGRVHDAATAPKAFRFAGFLYLFIALKEVVFFLL